jgi:hypothetical protein
MSNASGTPIRPSTVAATVEIGAIRWVPVDGRITSDWSEPATATTLAGGAPAERRALVHVPREEWTAVHVQVLCWRVVTWWAVGVVLHESFLPLWLARDPQALPTLIAVVAAGFGVDDRLRRRLPPPGT